VKRDWPAEGATRVPYWVYQDAARTAALSSACRRAARPRQRPAGGLAGFLHRERPLHDHHCGERGARAAPAGALRRVAGHAARPRAVAAPSQYLRVAGIPAFDVVGSGKKSRSEHGEIRRRLPGRPDHAERRNGAVCKRPLSGSHPARRGGGAAAVRGARRHLRQPPLRHAARGPCY